jgi:branched-chain amino acid transport system substrate-binding protein
MNFSKTLALLALSAGLSQNFLHAENGVTDTEIAVGQTAVFSGPTSALGLGMKAGLEAAISEVNDAGGVGGRKIKLVAKDDSYEPDKAIASAKELISTDKVFLLIAGVGTPTANAIIPICEENSVPFVGAFTGAGTLRSPFKKQVVNVRASYNQEMEELAKLLVDDRKLTKVACFHQNDGYGQAGLSGITAALKKRGMELVATGTYERNTTAVKAGLLDVRKGEPQAVVMVGTYKACAEFIRLARKLGMTDTLYCNISFVGTKALVAELGAEAEGTIISQVVPNPYGDSLPVLKDYAAALKKYQPAQEPDWISLEGYLVGRFFADALSKSGASPTRASFLEAIQQQKNFDLGGFALGFGPEDHQGSDNVYLTHVKDGKVVELK